MIPRLLTALALTAALALAPACRRGEAVGAYDAQPPSGPVSMVLQEDGRGVWKTDMDEISFSWSLRQGKLVLHTRDGGVITGRPATEGWLVSVPGADEYLFRRTTP
ncbi:hypothetical protein [Desulfocurvibacter africanus]|uniref:hypothetical protein n=1 Tax=Desulfocurvibacter africanus TaxID=873 RepID=UPI0003FB114F|nr:hypothetical protein [Desulfocurvibacter africanus]